MGAEQAWLLPAVPAGVFVLLALFGRYLPRQGDVVGVAAIGTSFLLFFFVLVDYVGIGEGADLVLKSWAWSDVGEFSLRFGIAVDPITIVMLGVVTSVALMVNIFSIGYMKGEARYYWFFAVLQLFAASMLMLVLADNLVLVYVSWELVGVCSFLLIGFYWEKRSATEAAKKAFVTTRIGDVGLLIGIILLWKESGTFNIEEIIRFAEHGGYGSTYLTVAMLFVFLGAMGKSAQFPFHVWLPDAMEGPTPVSALIHAATMVVAGVYLVARLLPVFEVAGDTMLVITLVGLITAVLTGFMAFAQTDIKKVLAYSTVGQLGFMFVALGSGAPSAAMFHLMTHAFFKSLLFLGSGSVIIATHHNQDMSKLGGMWKKLPITGTTFLIGSAALAGVVPLAGFWSKDEVLNAANHHWGVWALTIAGGAAVMTAFYTTRLFIRTFLGAPRDEHVYEHTKEPSWTMTGPLVFLATLAAVSGFFVFEGFGTALGFPGGITQFVFLEEPEKYSINLGLGALSLAIAGLGIAIGAWIYWGNSLERSTSLAQSYPWAYRWLRNKFYFDEAYQWGIDHLVLGAGYVAAWFDRYVVNDTGVNGSGEMTSWGGFVLKFLQTGRVPNYAMGIALGVVGLAFAGLMVRG